MKNNKVTKNMIMITVLLMFVLRWIEGVWALMPLFVSFGVYFAWLLLVNTQCYKETSRQSESSCTDLIPLQSESSCTDLVLLNSHLPRSQLNNTPCYNKTSRRLGFSSLYLVPYNKPSLELIPLYIVPIASRVSEPTTLPTLENAGSLEKATILPTLVNAGALVKGTTLPKIVNVVKVGDKSFVKPDTFSKHGLSFDVNYEAGDNTIVKFITLCTNNFEGYTEGDFKSLLSNLESYISEFNTLGDLGYVNNDTKFPIVVDFIDWFNTGSTSKEKSGSHRTSSLYWTYQLLMMCLYHTASKAHKVMTEVNNKVESFDDLCYDMKAFSSRCYESLDPVVKMVLQNRGVSAIKNIYVGYDAEYKEVDFTRHLNKVVSYQLALNHKVFIRVPQPFDFQLGKKDPKSGVFRQQVKVSDFEGVLQRSINELCLLHRAEFSSKADNFNKLLTNALVESGFEYYAKNNFKVFGFKRSENKYLLEYVTNEMVTSTELFEKCLKLDSELGPSLTWFKEFVCSLSCKGGKDYYDFEKRLSRKTIYYNGGRVSFTKSRNIYLCAHLSKADLSLLKDFDTFKKNLDIVNKEFMTITPVKFDGFNLHVRDTKLLAPAASKSLAAIGEMYGSGFEKVVIDKRWYEDMDLLLKHDPLLFSLYAIRDVQITLKHVNELEDFCFGNIDLMGVPLTLSSISKAYVLKKWADDNYSYNFTGKYLIGNPAQIFTPKGLFAARPVGVNLAYFIANYKGGRNESFMYGVDSSSRIWYDYDLTSAYTTAMAFLGDPDYWKVQVLNVHKFKDLISDYNKLLSTYTAVECDFRFPDDTSYPSIPVYVDETTTVYPLSGRAYLTGFEIVAALQQNCRLWFIAGVSIPFKTTATASAAEVFGLSKEYDGEVAKWGSIGTIRGSFAKQPFYSIMKEVQIRRKAYAKGTIGNHMWKNIGNSIYGKVVSGMADKKRFDLKTREMRRLEASILTNPIIASYTTAFIRSLVGECLHNIQRLGGKVVSVTTDGFITDIENLELKILDPVNKLDNSLLKVYRKLRYDLSDGNPEALELKKQVSGLISWSTRGQLSFDGKLKAMTGYQSDGVDTVSMVDMLTKTIRSPGDKAITYIQKTLRSSKDIFEKGGHVTSVYKDQTFRVKFDNRRLINHNPTGEIDTLLDSKPVRNARTCGDLRKLGNIMNKLYDKTTHTLSGSLYKTKVDLAIRNFIRLYLDETQGYGLVHGTFKGYNDIIKFVKAFNPGMRITKQSISNLRHRKVALKLVPDVKETREFVDYIKTVFPEFTSQKFLQS